MPRPSLKSPKKLATVREMSARGVPGRDIAAAVNVDEKTVRNWLAADKPAPKRKAKRRAAPVEAEVAAALMSTPLPTSDDPGALADVQGRLALVRGLLDRLAPAVEVEEFPATQWVT